jgi:glycosyltransferase involved in cell wall biosynthesis
MRLAILSHTEHFRVGSSWQGLEPTVREIRQLTSVFDGIVHAACGYPGSPSVQTLPYESDRIKFQPLKPAGGLRMFNKLGILSAAPSNLAVAMRVVAQADVVQLRLPTGMGMYLLPAMLLAGRRKYWSKYAGNWIQERPPLSYALQRWWLKNCQSQPVTVNGQWNDASHILAFENPCLSGSEVELARARASTKDYSAALRLCFVGRVEKAKGVDRILAGLGASSHKAEIERVDFIGSGSDLEYWQRKAAATGVRCFFHGQLPRERINVFYADAHCLLLPSESEGFPKVVAEAAAFGVIPVVSAVSAIPQYVNNLNGFLWDPRDSFPEWFAGLPLDNRALLRVLGGKIVELAERFTYEHYCQRIEREVLPLLNTNG